MSRLQTSFPEGTKFYRADIDGSLMMYREGEPGESVETWVDENTVSGTSYDVVETGAGEIVTVLLSLPGGGISSGLSVGRRFILVRHEDVSTVSGTGVVAQGVQFPDGSVALRWCCPGLPPSTAVWDSVEAVIAVHGHQGKTEIEWVD